MARHSGKQKFFFPEVPTHPKGYRYGPTLTAPDGKKFQKTFWLGKDRNTAELKKTKIDGVIATAKLEGRAPSDEDFQKATLILDKPIIAEQVVATPVISTLPALFRPVITATDLIPANTATIVPPSDPQTLTLYGGMRLFIHSLQHTDIGTRHYETLVHRLWCITNPNLYEPTELSIAHIPDCRLADVTYEQLKLWRKIYTQRPVSRKTSAQISLQTMRHLLQSLHQCLAWLDRNNRWLAPRNWDIDSSGSKASSLFAVSERQEWKLMNAKEQLDSENDSESLNTYIAPEVSILYKLAHPALRKYMLCGLNFGWGQKMIATLRKDHPKMEHGEWFITRKRGKTGMPGKWWVWPETMAFLTEAIKKTPKHPEELMFLTDNQYPILHKTLFKPISGFNRSETDIIAQLWSDLSKVAAASGVRKLGFSALRKYGGQSIENISGSHDLAQVFLAHKNATVARKHYIKADGNIAIGTTTMQRCIDVQRKYHHSLKPMFDAVKQPLDKLVKTLQIEVAKQQKGVAA